jgi:arylsulfatase A-like enzyme
MVPAIKANPSRGGTHSPRVSFREISGPPGWGKMSTKNVLVVVADDMPEGGFTDEVMPSTFQHFAQRGVPFANGYAVDPWCAPSRATLFTGLWVHDHGVVRGTRSTLEGTWHTKDLEADTIATRARAAGAKTCMIGKYINGARDARVPAGWDRFLSYPPVPPGADTYTIHVDGKPRQISRSAWSDTALIFHQASDSVKNNRNEPWLLYVAPNSPHGPPSATEEHADDFDGVELPKGPAHDPGELPEPAPESRESYEGMLEECRDIDDGIAKLLGALRDTEQLTNTLIIFTSDNGYLYGEHGEIHKSQPWEESVGVPLVAAGPELPGGVKTRAPAGHIDIPYTALAALEADRSGMKGSDLRRFLAPDWQTRLLLEHPHTGWALVTDGAWTYLEYPDGKKHLYDTVGDPHQTANHAGEGLAEEGILRQKLSELKAGEVRASLSSLGRRASIRSSTPHPTPRSPQRDP